MAKVTSFAMSLEIFSIHSYFVMKILSCEYYTFILKPAVLFCDSIKKNSDSVFCFFMILDSSL